MKPLVLKAQAKELYDSLKVVKDINRDNLNDVNQKLLKMMLEVNEMQNKFE
ncbi:MAG TPA: hypothetical protein P5123_10930 [Spirochaetota bacterium]|nr:hypothetical protein [Spirochaetota bacterium]